MSKKAFKPPLRLSKSGCSIRDANDRIVFEVKRIEQAEQFIEDSYALLDLLGELAKCRQHVLDEVKSEVKHTPIWKSEIKPVKRFIDNLRGK